MTKKVSEFSALFDVKRAHEEGGKWIVEGFATTADLDVDDGYITEEALKGAEDDLLKYSTLLYNHDRNAELGKILETKYIPEERALWIKALISKTAPDVWEKIKEGVLNKFSINGRALEWEEMLIKGLGKIVTVIKSLSLFEASLVTVPADAMSRTLAFYVERSIKNLNSKEDNSMKLKKKEEGTKTFGRDKERVEGLIDTVEEALNSEDQEIHASAMRSVLDFLKGLLATEFGTTEVENKAAEGNLKAIVGDAVKEGIGELATQISSLAESMKTFVDKAIADDEEKIKAQKEADAQKEEDAKRKADEDKKGEDKKEKVIKAVDGNGELKKEFEKMTETVNSLKTLVEKAVPVRRGEGSEHHKEDKRELTDKIDDVTKTQEFKDKKNVDPVGRLKMLLGSAGQKKEEEEE